MSRSVNDGNKRWAIAPPPPTSMPEQARSGEFSLSLDGDLSAVESAFFARRTARSAAPHSRTRPVPSTLPPEDLSATGGIEPSDSDRPTETPDPPPSILLDRDFPTIPAAPMVDADLMGRPVPPVATGRGFFLETLRVEAEPTSSRIAPASVTPLADLSIEFDADEGL